MDACPHCDNRFGFVCGSCCRCDWNYLSHKFDHISVDPDMLNAEDRAYFVTKHANSTARMCQPFIQIVNKD